MRICERRTFCLRLKGSIRVFHFERSFSVTQLEGSLSVLYLEESLHCPWLRRRTPFGPISLQATHSGRYFGGCILFSRVHLFASSRRRHACPKCRRSISGPPSWMPSTSRERRFVCYRESSPSLRKGAFCFDLEAFLSSISNEGSFSPAHRWDRF